MKSLGKALKESSTINSITVDSKEKDSISTVNSNNTVNSDLVRERSITEQIEEVIQNNNYKLEDQARYIAKLLDDEKSLSWYNLLVKEHNPSVLIEFAHYTKEMYEAGKLTKVNKAVYFLSILRRRKMKTNFKELKTKV